MQCPESPSVYFHVATIVPMLQWDYQLLNGIYPSHSDCPSLTHTNSAYNRASPNFYCSVVWTITGNDAYPKSEPSYLWGSNRRLAIRLNKMEGYSKLAIVMSSQPDVRMFRNFSALNIQNILYLQAELLHLQKEWREIITDDAMSGDQARVDTQFDLLKLQEGAETENEMVQWAKFKEIRAKLAQYSKVAVMEESLMG